MTCKYCNKECKNSNSLRNHERLCKNNPNRQIPKNNFIKYNQYRKENFVKGTNQYIKARKLGLPIPEVSYETKKKLSESRKNKLLSEEHKKRISEGMHKAVSKYPESYSSCNINGRVKIYEYNGVKLNGKWELEFAKYLDENKIVWERPKVGIEYIWNNNIHLYFPDFYLPEFDIYVEVKGLIRDKDYCKWKNIKNLILIQKNEIIAIRKNKFNIYKLLT